jgi:flagellin
MRIEKHQGDHLTHKLNTTVKEKDKVLEQMATGKRINRASDDAAGMSMAKEFEKQVRGFRGASDNIDQGMSALSIADGGASSIGDMLQRQSELAVQSANGALNDGDRAVLDNEFQSLSQEIDRISKSTDFNGNHLLDGTGPMADGTGNIQAGDGTAGQVAVGASDLTLAGLGTGGSSLSSSGGALQAMGAIDAAMRKVNDNRATTGGLQNRLEFASSNVSNQMINTTKGLSKIEDLDYAKASTEKARLDILQNSGSSAISQFNQLSRTHLLALLQ